MKWLPGKQKCLPGKFKWFPRKWRIFPGKSNWFPGKWRRLPGKWRILPGKCKRETENWRRDNGLCLPPKHQLKQARYTHCQAFKKTTVILALKFDHNADWLPAGVKKMEYGNQLNTKAKKNWQLNKGVPFPSKARESGSVSIHCSLGAQQKISFVSILFPHWPALATYLCNFYPHVKGEANCRTLCPAWLSDIRLFWL